MFAASNSHRNVASCLDRQCPDMGMWQPAGALA
jgi:hypothetical protein